MTQNKKSQKIKSVWQDEYENIDTQGQSPNLPIEVWDAINVKLPVSAQSQFAQTCKGAYALGYVSHNGNAFYNNFIRLRREQIHRFLLCVVRGQKKEVEEMIIADPSLLLARGRVKDYSGRTIEGTALGIALGAEDVSHGESLCNLLLLNPPDDLKDGALVDYMRNLNNINMHSVYYIRCANKLFYLYQANDECIEIKLDPAAIKAFDERMKPASSVKTLSKEQVKILTSMIGHNPSEEMAEMIQRHMRDKLQNGEEVIAAQIAEQFPAGWQEEEKERAKKDLEALNEVVVAIAQSEKEADCDAALEKFRKYLAPNDVIKTGKHFNTQLLGEALVLYSKKYSDFGGWSRYRNNLFWQKVIGYIERCLPACYAHAISQGLCYRLYYFGEIRKLERGSDFYPFDSNPLNRLGYEHAVDIDGVRRGVATLFSDTELYDFYRLCQTKNTNAAKIIQCADRHQKNRCTMM